MNEYIALQGFTHGTISPKRGERITISDNFAGALVSKGLIKIAGPIQPKKPESGEELSLSPAAQALPPKTSNLSENGAKSGKKKR